MQSLAIALRVVLGDYKNYGVRLDMCNAENRFLISAMALIQNFSFSFTHKEILLAGALSQRRHHKRNTKLRSSLICKYFLNNICQVTR